MTNLSPAAHWSNLMIDITSFGGKIGNICWQNTWHGLWGHAGFWDKRLGMKPCFILWGIRPGKRLFKDSPALEQLDD